MHTRHSRLSVLVALAFLTSLLPSTTLAQQSDPATQSPSTPVASYDRLFLNFIEDATIVERQWWEGQFEYSDADVLDTTLLRGVVAFQPWRDIEIGGTMGFGWTDTDLPGADGTGATDLDAWGKYYLGAQGDGKVDLAVGVLGTIPTGDNSAGLGWDAFAMGFFGSLRWRISNRVILSGNAGFQINGEGQTLNSPELDGKTAERLGVGVAIPLSERLNVTGEWQHEGERFEGTEKDSRLAAGLNWRFGGRSLLRAAFAGGVTDGAPDWQFLVSYAVQFP